MRKDNVRKKKMMLWWRLRQLKSNKWKKRERAVKKLSESKSPRTARVLVRMLKDEDGRRNARVKVNAMIILERMGEPAIGPLMEVLEDQDSYVRKTAAEILGRIGSAAVEPLIATLKHRDSDVRRVAAEALDALQWQPRDTTERVLKEIALEQWGELHWFGSSAVEQLIWVLKDEKEHIRRHAAEALRREGNVQALGPLVEALKDADSGVRGAAAEALGRIGDRRAVAALVEALKEQDSNLQKVVAEALGQLGDGRAVEPLMELLRDGNGQVQQATVEALGKLGDQRALVPLMKMIKVYDSNLRRGIAEALGTLGDRRAVESLVEQLGDQDANVRKAAIEALEKIGDRRAVEPLQQRLKDEDMSVWEAAAKALMSLGWRPVDDVQRAICAVAVQNWEEAARLGGVAVDALVKVLRDQRYKYYAEGRRAIIEVLGKIGDTSAVEALAETLKDGEDAVRAAAVRALVRMGEAAVKPLVKALKEPFFGTQRAASEALVRIGEPAVESLVEVLKAEDNGERWAAAEILGKLGNGRAVEPLVEALKDRESRVRRAAAEALTALGWQPIGETQHALRAVALEQWEEAVLLGIAAAEPLLWAITYSEDRYSQMEALKKIKDPRAVEPLVKALEDENDHVRMAAAGTLTALDWQPENETQRALRAIALQNWAEAARLGSTAVEPLVKALQDNKDDKHYRRQAMMLALGSINDTRIVLPLVTIAQQDHELAQEAITLLERFLKYHVSEVASEALRVVAHLDSVYQNVHWSDDYDHERTAEKTVNCTQVRQLVQRVLIQRSERI